MLRSLQEIFGQSGGGNAPNFNQSITSLDALSSRRMKKMKSANQTSSILSESGLYLCMIVDDIVKS